MENETFVAPKTERELLLDEILLCREGMIQAKNWITNAQKEILFLNTLPKVDTETDKKVNSIVGQYKTNMADNIKILVDLFPKMEKMQADIKLMPAPEISTKLPIVDKLKIEH